MTWVDEVREAVLTIPAGSVASYGEIGRHLGWARARSAAP